MNFDFKSTDTFYPGVQKSSLFSNETLRKSLVVFAAACLLDFVGCLFVPVGLKRESVWIIVSMLAMYPGAFWMAGGLPRAAWPWYAGFALCGTAAVLPPVAYGYYKTIVFAAPAVFFFYVLSRKAPNITKKSGYQNRMPLLHETGGVLLAAAVLIYPTYYVLGAKHVRMPHLLPKQYALVLIIGLLEYGPIFAIILGMLMNRMLSLNFQLIMSVVINSVLLFACWAPGFYGDPGGAMVVAGGVMMALLCAFTISLVYYYCRSPRPVMIAYMLFFLFYKPLIFVRM